MPTRDEINRALASGERAPDMSQWVTTAFKDYIPDAIMPYAQGLERLDRGIVAGAANALPQVPQFGEYLWNVGGAGYDTLVNDKPFQRSLEQRRYGVEGSQALQDFVSSKMEQFKQGMSEEERNNPALLEELQARIYGSKAYNELALAHTSEMNKSNTEWQDYVRGNLGLQPTAEMTSFDELADITGGALIPTPGGLSKLISKAPAGIRQVARLAEWLAPMSSGPGNAALNVAIPEAATQGLRYMTDAPSYPGFTAGLPEELAAQSAQRRTGQQEAASAPVPFQAAAVADNNPMPFQYGTYRQQNQTVAGGTSTAPAATQINPDRDPEGGGNGSGWAWLAGIAGAATLVGAALRGKVHPGILGKEIQDVDSPAAAGRMDIQPTDNIQLQPSLQRAPGDTRWDIARKARQRVGAGLQKTRAIPSVARNVLTAAGDANVEAKVSKIVREVDTASPLEIGHAFKRTHLYGELPELGRNTVPLAKLRLDVETKMSPVQQEMYYKALVAGDRLDTHNVTNASAADLLNELRIKAQGERNAARKAQLLTQIAQDESALNASMQPGAPLGKLFSADEARQILRAADADPLVKQALRDHRQIVADVSEANVKLQLDLPADVNERLRTRPNFVPLSKNEFDKSANTLTKGAYDRLKATAKGRSEPTGDKYQLFQSHRSPVRTNREVDDLAFDQIKNPLDSLETFVHEFHRQHRNHRATQTFFETIADTSEHGKAAQVAHAPVTLKEFETISPRSKLGHILNEPNVISYNAGGMMHIMRLADSETARALRNNPSSTMQVMDLVRRTVQTTLTGRALAPAFAPVAAEFEKAVAQVKLPHEWSKGMLDAWFKRAFPGTPLAHTFDFYPDPTLRLQQLATITEQVSNSAINRLKQVMGDHLAEQSTLFKQMGTQQSQAVAAAGLRELTDSRTRLQFLQKHGITDHMDIASEHDSIFKDWTTLQRMLEKRGPVTRSMRALLGFYTDTVDAIRNSVKVAIASQNLTGMITKYKGFDNIPNDVMRRYTRDMRYMSGDMSRAIGNETLSKYISAAPYGQHVVNSTAHMLEGIHDVKSGSYVLGRILTNMILPKVVLVYMLSRWMQSDDGTNEFVDHWWKDMPKWQRMSVVPIPSPQFMYDFATGAKSKMTMGDVIFMRQAPEAIPFAEVFGSMFQAAGAYGLYAQDKQTWKDMASALGTIANVNVPIVDAWTEFTKDQDLPENLAGDSDTVRRFIGAIGAMFGMSIDIVGGGYAAASNSLNRGTGIGDALERGFMFAGEVLKQKWPETLASPLFGNQRRHYTKSQVRERNQSKFDMIEDVSKSRSQQMQDIKGNEFTMPATDDMDAQTMMRELHSTANARTMHSLRDKRAKLYGQLQRLDYNRGHEKLPPSEYTRRSEQYKMMIHDIDRQEEETFDRMEARLAARFGHLGVSDTESAIQYITQSMHP